MEFIMVLIILSNFGLLGSSRIGMYIRTLAWQGVLLGLVPLCAGEYDWRVLGLSGLIIVLKGLLFPYFLRRVLRDISDRREVEPFIGYAASILLGILFLGISLWLGTALNIPDQARYALFVPTAFFTIFTGFLLLISRRKALTQVMGYIVLENGIFIFGTGLAGKAPFLVEMGILLDVFVAVFIMGIMIFHINREFDDIDTFQMTVLKD